MRAPTAKSLRGRAVWVGDSYLGELVHDDGQLAVFVDPTSDLVSVNIRFFAGSRNDPPARTGIAHLFEHLYFGAAGGLAAGEYQKTIGALGGVYNATTSADWTIYYATARARELANVMALETRRFRAGALRIDTEALDRERGVVLAERAQTVDGPVAGTAGERIASYLFDQSSGYNHQPIGRASDLRSVTVADCQTFYEQWYTRENVAICIAGNVHPDLAIELGGELLDALPASGARVRPPTLPLAGRPTRRIDEHRGSTTRVVLGMALPPMRSAGYSMARFGAFALGRGKGSYLQGRLVRELRIASGLSMKTMPRHDEGSIGLVELKAAIDVAPGELIAHYDEAMADVREERVVGALRSSAIARYNGDWAADDDRVVHRARGLTLAIQLTGSAATYFADGQIDSCPTDQLRTAIGHWDQPERRLEIVF